jgi:nitroreductase/NAD-dependent dihydropyrimidine dehydrogenase PreA subunit
MLECINMLVNLISIDHAICIKCKACVLECSPEVFDMTENGPNVARPESCIKCGHCVAICPVNAITHKEMPSTEFNSAIDSGIKFDQFYQLGRNRHSVRRFKDKPVSPEIIEKLLAAVRYTPTGQNAQEIQYLVISNEQILTAIRKELAFKFQWVERAVNFPLISWIAKKVAGKEDFIRLHSSLTRMMKKYHEGKDPFLHGAPLFVVLYCNQKTAMRHLDAGIAGHHLNLAAETLGLGACWIGYFIILSKFFVKVRKVAQIPSRSSVLASLAIGYPQFKYKFNCPKLPLNIKYL